MRIFLFDIQSALNLSQAAAQTAAATAVAAMGLLNSDGSQNTEIANEILKELTTPTKQNKYVEKDLLSSVFHHILLFWCQYYSVILYNSFVINRTKGNLP